MENKQESTLHSIDPVFKLSAGDYEDRQVSYLLRYISSNIRTIATIK